MKVGDYVRTKGGRIGIIQDWEFVDEEYAKENIMIKFQDELTDSLYHKSNIIKHSKKLINLIEVGDYVNGLQVYETGTFGHNGKTFCRLYGNVAPFYEDDIKTIVTREQFESMEYKVV